MGGTIGLKLSTKIIMADGDIPSSFRSHRNRDGALTPLGYRPHGAITYYAKKPLLLMWLQCDIYPSAAWLLEYSECTILLNLTSQLVGNSSEYQSNAGDQQMWHCKQLHIYLNGVILVNWAVWNICMNVACIPHSHYITARVINMGTYIEPNGKNDLTWHVTHREAVFGLVIHSIIDGWHYVMREESTPRYTQLEVSLVSIPLSCLTIGLDIGLIQGPIAGSLWSFTQAQKVIRIGSM